MFLSLVFCLIGVTLADTHFKPPVFGNGPYMVKGKIHLPYAEIHEPFQSWVGLTSTNDFVQRIDYYDGVDSYFYYPSGSGRIREIIPTDFKYSCYDVTGAGTGAQIQHFFPDLRSFALQNETVEMDGKTCSVYESIIIRYGRRNTYEFFVHQLPNGTYIPVRFQFLGFDALLGSHYDEYIIQYYDYFSGHVEPQVFEKAETAKACQVAPFATYHSVNHYFTMEQDWIHPHFNKFQQKYQKKYDSAPQLQLRKDIFRKNLRLIDSINRAKRGYTLAINHLADWSREERKVLHPNKGRSRRNNAPRVHQVTEQEKLSIPDSVDWRPIGAVSPVKDQSICGSCWSFGASEVIEGAFFMKNGYLIRLSAQNLMDCSWSFGNNGCDGGLDYQAYEWVIQNGGIATEASYPYKSADMFCGYANATVGASISSYVNVTSGDVQALKHALATKGPISISIDASQDVFSFYSSGVLYEPKCKNGVDDLDHSVLAVGYGVYQGQSYILVKNSWSVHWGNQGYIMMSDRDNNCGVATAPTYVVIDDEKAIEATA